MISLDEALEKITDTDHEAEAEARRRWNSIAHPLHSMGRFEDAIVQIAGIQGSADVCLEKKALLVMCADNGIVREGVTQTGSEVTACVAENFLKGKASAAILCGKAGADIFPLDVGMNTDTAVPARKISYGTADFLEKPAMTRTQAIASVEAGIACTAEKYALGYRIFAAGEMGIGNTTTSAAMISCLLHKSPEEVTGRGAGLSSEALERKRRVIREGIARRRPDPDDPVDVLSKVGGFDIGGMAGVFLGGAMLHCPVIMDGIISQTAALVAVRLCPDAGRYILASHVSGEPASAGVMNALGKHAFIDAELRTGEGCGAVMMMPLLDMADAVYRDMPTFEEEKIKAYEELK